MTKNNHPDGAADNRKAPSASKEELACRKIKEFMYARKLSPGQKIIYRDLEEMLGMSKTPITNALGRLEQEGLVVSTHNRGYYVKKLNKGEIVQLYGLRVRLEEIAVDYAIANARPEDLAALKEALKAYLDHDSEFYDSTRLKLDLEFHLQIARMGKNDFLISILTQFYERALVGLPAFFMTPLIPQFKKDHILIFEALESGDSTKTKAIIKDHEMASLRFLDKID